MKDSEYFCSYMTSMNGLINGYGDFIFTGKVNNANKLLGDIKKEIISKYYSNNQDVEIVITALNKL
ncbi:MAG: hypothetical protein Tp1137MES00d2C23059491_47 [Prokaryotic dsDNA virus sp.]|nr:MAG: hypothetical protein Tp1137MES00d2C23059491_47 [Prokaryotic dsDNA virus sp.]|tara:strand:+ start:8353 stop:8550 length:198 start_codon:yes stop_codon:yes gene_type:complete